MTTAGVWVAMSLGRGVPLQGWGGYAATIGRGLGSGTRGVEWAEVWRSSREPKSVAGVLEVPLVMLSRAKPRRRSHQFTAGRLSTPYSAGDALVE